MLLDFGYTATDPSGLVENEHCPVYRAFIVDTSVLRPDPDEVMDYQWLTWPDLIATAERAPGILSPWAVAQVRCLRPLRMQCRCYEGHEVSKGPTPPQPWPASRACSLNRSTSWRCCGAS